MDFLKKHYEKVILGVVLLGLAGGLVFIPIKITSESDALEEKLRSRTRVPSKPLAPLEMVRLDAVKKHLGMPTLVDLSTTNKLFNPLTWQRAPDGHPTPFNERNVGPMAVTVTKIYPLNLTLTLDSVTTTSDGGVRYVIGVQREAAATTAAQQKKQFGCALNTKTEYFTLRKVDGPPENPTKMTLELNDTSESAVLSKDKPFQRVDGYKADLKYEPLASQEKHFWPGKRVGSPPITLNGEEYKIVAISENEVVIMSSNQKKWPIPFKENPTP